MSIRQIALVLQMPPKRLSNTEFRVLVHLADRADDDGGNIFPDVARLMKVTGRAKREVNRTLSALLKRGWLRAEQLDAKPRWRLALRLGNTKKRYTSVPIFGTPSDAQTTRATNHLGAGTDRPPSFDPSYVHDPIVVPNSQVPASPPVSGTSEELPARKNAPAPPPVENPKPPPKARTTVSKKIIAFAQLCAVARDQIKADPSLLTDQASWKYDLKAWVSKNGFESPPSEQVNKALDAVTITRKRTTPCRAGHRL